MSVSVSASPRRPAPPAASRPRAAARLALVSAAVVVAGGAAGCRSHAGFRQQYVQIRPMMVDGEWAKAAEVIQGSKDTVYKEADRVMFWLNLGTAQHFAGQYEASQANFVKAEEAMQDLWTKSISQEASKFLVNETIQDYPGEDFEKILVYYFTALNAVKRDKLSDALVEARRADEFLKKIQVEYEKEEQKVGTLYKQDAFMLWLVGLFYEIEGSYSDAYLAYKTAYAAYKDEYAGKFAAPSPSFLKEDLLRTAQLSGRTDAVAELEGVSGSSLKAAAEGMAELVLLHGNGEAPYKQETFIDGLMPDGKIIRIAIPKFVPNAHQIRYAELEAAGQTARTELMEPVARIALDNYTHRLPAITARAIARAIIKYAATKGAEKAVKGSGNDGKRALIGALVGIAGNVASAVSEAADLRAWTTLPAEIGVTRLWVPAGAQTVQVRYFAAGGQVGRTDQLEVTLNPGERKIISVRTLQ
jgi:hypothetical protein